VDTEPRYLSTVRVTAAIDSCLVDPPQPHYYTLEHWAVPTSITAPLGFAGSCAFVKQSYQPTLCVFLSSQSYLEDLLLLAVQSHFAEFLSLSSPYAYVYSHCLTCVGLLYDYSALRAFSCS